MGRRTALGGTALVLGANLPDIDVLAYFAGPAGDLQWRRGWTHGVLALTILPFLLAGSLVLLHRLRGARRGRHSAPLFPKQLLLLSAVAIFSHPVLDTLNTYGVRWLMPFSGRWFYGDALFIIDPWVWLALGAGLLWGRWRKVAASGGPAPARIALLVTIGYISSMWLSGLIAGRIIARDVERVSEAPIRELMVGPVPLDVLSRNFVVQQDGMYRVGTFHWLGRPQVDPTSVRSFPDVRPRHPALAVAESTLVLRRFLIWARFPTFDVEQTGLNRYLVHVVDLRYARAPGDRFGAVSVPISLSDSLSPR